MSAWWVSGLRVVAAVDLHRQPRAGPAEVDPRAGEAVLHVRLRDLWEAFEDPVSKEILEG